MWQGYPELGSLSALSRPGGGDGQLTWGLPGAAQGVATDWLGRRLAWWPRGVPRRRRVGIVSSRLGRDLQRRKSWFAALRTVCIRLDTNRDLLVTSGAVSSQRFVCRCGQLFGLPRLWIAVADEGQRSLEEWGQSMLSDTAASRHPHFSVYLSPRLDKEASPACQSNVCDTPWTDRALAVLSDRLIVLHLRPGGNMQRLVRERLSRGEFPGASVFLALGEGLVPPKLAEPLMDAGAVGWYVMDPETPAGRNTGPPWATGGEDVTTAGPIIDCPASDNWPYLTHCTRRRSGPWPGQTEDDYLDDLLLDRSGADHSAWAALWRIIRAGRLVAASDLIRGDNAVVSLTAVPLPEIAHLRTFRSHLARWDFEPYGICIRRDWLEQHGARPVHYGDESLWAGLPESERPLFQKRISRTATGNEIDWSVEREWRVVGDLLLGNVPPDAAMLFVPSRDEAEYLATFSRWPVTVLDEKRSQGR